MTAAAGRSKDRQPAIADTQRPCGGLLLRSHCLKEGPCLIKTTFVIMYAAGSSLKDFADPPPVLDPGGERTNKGYFCVLARDNRPSCGRDRRSNRQP